MVNAPAWSGEPQGGGYSGSSGQWSDEGWDAPTHVKSASADPAASYPATPSYGEPPSYPGPPTYQPVTSPDSTPHVTAADAFISRSATRAAARASTRERGIAGWQAVLVLIAIAGLGGVFDLVRGSSVKGGFNIALIVAAVVAILIVRRSEMFPVLVAPPLVYFVASAGLLYIRSSGLHDRSRLLDAAINWLVYGFPAIAGATAAVLIIGGARMLLRR